MKKKGPWIALILFSSLAVAQVVKNWVSPIKAAAQWEFSGLNADGSPCTDLAGFRLAITTNSIDLRVAGIPIKTITLANPEIRDTTLAALLVGQPTGDYRLWALAYDVAGNESQWSDPVEFSLDPTAPGKPKFKVVK